MRSPARRRRGLFLVAASLALAGAAALLVLAGTAHRRRSTRWVRRVEAEQAEVDLLDSALEESFHWLQETANEPGTRLYQGLRAGEPPPRTEPPLAWSRARAEELGGDAPFEVEVRFLAARPLGGGPGDEWGGEVWLRARRGRREASRIHELRVVRLSLPAPLDEVCFHDWRTPEAGMPSGELQVDPAQWRDLATQRVAPGEGASTQEAFEALLASQEALTGVVHVEGAPGDPLRLRGYTHRGRTLLVSAGPLELVDVRLADPTRDQLVVLALGDTTLGGDLEAVVAMSHAEGSPAPARRLLTGLDVEGALVLASGAYQASRATHLRCAPRAGSDASGRPRLAAYHVAFSPRPTGAWSS